MYLVVTNVEECADLMLHDYNGRRLSEAEA